MSRHLFIHQHGMGLQRASYGAQSLAVAETGLTLLRRRARISCQIETSAGQRTAAVLHQTDEREPKVATAGAVQEEINGEVRIGEDLENLLPK